MGEFESNGIYPIPSLVAIINPPEGYATTALHSNVRPVRLNQHAKELDDATSAWKGLGMKLLRLEEVIEMTGLSRSSIYRYEGNSAFPKRRRTGPNTVRWLEADVVAWMESRPVIVPMQIEDLPPRNPHRRREH